MKAAWRDLLPVVLVVVAAVLLGRLSGSATSRPTQIAVFVALLIVAFTRPISAFYAAALCQALVLTFPGIVPGWHILGPGLLVAALLGARKTASIGPLKSPFNIVSLATAGYMAINALVFGASGDLAWWPPVFVIGSGLAFQLLVRGKASHLSAWAGVASGSVLLAGVTVIRILMLGLPSIHYEAAQELNADSNYLSMLIGLGVFPALVLAGHLADGRRRIASILTMLCAPLCLLGVGLLASRGVTLALAVASIPALLDFVRRKKGQGTVILLAGMIAVVAMGYWLGSYQGGKLEVYQRLSLGIHRYDQIGQRYTLALDAFDAFAERPLSSKLFGEGPYSSFTAIGQKTATGWTHTHNAFLEYLLDYGLIGFGLFLALLWYVFRSAVAADADFRHLLLSQIAFLVVCGLSINPFYHLPAVISLGLAGASYRGSSRARRRPALLHRQEKA